MKSTTICLTLLLFTFAITVHVFANSTGVLLAKDKTASITTKVVYAWKNLKKSTNMCEAFDYFPNGGMKNFACHLKSFTSYKDFISLMGVSPFLSGPHGGELILNSDTDFGRYNPVFVKKLRQVMIPGAIDSTFKKETQIIYKKFMLDLSRTFFITYKKLHEHPEYLKKEKALLVSTLKNRERFDHEKFYSFMETSYISDDGYSYIAGASDGNVAKTCVAFWIRRSIDKTDHEFLRGLLKLMAVYDLPFLLNKINSYQVAAKSGIRLREKPDQTSKKIDVIPFKTAVNFLERGEKKETIEGKTAYWLKVNYKEKTGWVFGGFLTGNIK